MVTHLFLNDPSDQEMKEQFNASVPSEDLERFAKSITDAAEKMTTYAGSAPNPAEWEADCGFALIHCPTSLERRRHLRWPASMDARWVTMRWM
jgi:hypothetical protein